MNECNVDNGGCTDECVNTQGSYSCGCVRRGYVLAADRRTCVEKPGRGVVILMTKFRATTTTMMTSIKMMIMMVDNLKVSVRENAFVGMISFNEKSYLYLYTWLIRRVLLLRIKLCETTPL